VLFRSCVRSGTDLPTAGRDGGSRLRQLYPVTRVPHRRRPSAAQRDPGPCVVRLDNSLMPPIEDHPVSQTDRQSDSRPVSQGSVRHRRRVADIVARLVRSITETNTLRLDRFDQSTMFGFLSTPRCCETRRLSGSNDKKINLLMSYPHCNLGLIDQSNL